MEISPSFLLWPTAVEYLPFPEEFKNQLKKVNWNNFIWQAVGLPINGAAYQFLGKDLYLEELPDGKIQVEIQQEFTGKIFLGGYFIDTDEQNLDNFFIAFEVLIIKGCFTEASCGDVQKQSKEEYSNIIASMQQFITKNLQRRQKWWFRWIYRPYVFVLRFLADCLLFLMNLIFRTLVYLINKLTPLDI